MASERFILVGPNAGKSGVWGGFEFKDGVCLVTGQLGDITAAGSLLSRFYSAHSELLANQMLEKGVTDLAELQAQAKAAVAPEGPGTSLLERIADVIKGLDPADEDHWTSNNLPALDVIGERVGQDVTRAQVNEVAPGYTRAAAKAAAK